MSSLFNSPQMMQAAVLLGISLVLFITSMVSYGLFNTKGCTDSSPNGNFQKCNMVNIFVAVIIFLLAGAVYAEKIDLSEENMVVLAGVISLVLFITGMIQYSALMNTVTCDATTAVSLKNSNMLIWMLAIIAMVLAGYRYYQIYNEKQKLLQFKFFLRK